MSLAEREKLEADFKAKLASISQEIERTAPNLKALDQYEVLREREREAILTLMILLSSLKPSVFQANHAMM